MVNENDPYSRNICETIFCGAVITRSIEILYLMMLLSLWHWKYRGWRSGSSYRIHHVTHWGRVTHTCVSKLPITGSDNGLSPGRRQAIIWTNAEILLIGTPGTNFNQILIEIHTFSFKKIHFKISSGKGRPFCLGLNVSNTTEINVSWSDVEIIQA